MKNDSKTQIFGYTMIFTGVLAIIFFGFGDNSSLIAISFFIIMLGVALAFPKLLEGNDGLSTMRIVVFMMTNVICLLLLKIGWGAHSLKEIELDEWWMGVIAFVFGAKATQSYFDNKFGTPKTPTEKTGEAVNPDQDPFKQLSADEQKRIINEYIKLESKNLKNKYPEIQGLSVRQKEKAGNKEDFYSLHFNIIKKENKLSSNLLIPEYFSHRTSNGTIYNIPTDITGIGEITFSYYTGNREMPKKLGLSCSRQIPKENGVVEVGTIGLKVLKNGEPYLLSCYHVLCAPELSQGITTFSSSSNDKIISPGDKDRNGDDPEVIARVTEGKFTNYIDVAIAKLIPKDSLISSYYNDNGKPNGILRLMESHAKESYKVKLVGRTSGLRSGYIIDNYEATTYVGKHTFNELIVCSKMSDGGDSGGTVTDYENNLIGMLVADSIDRSYIIPIEAILNTLQITIDY